MTIQVVVYSESFDTGGQGWQIKRAFDRYQPEFLVRAIHNAETYFAYPYDLRYKAGADNAYKLTEAADVLHFRNTFGSFKRLRSSGNPVGLILHHHGTRFRGGHQAIAEDARRRGAIQLASTIDLTLLEPDVAWLPAPFDLEALWAMRLKALDERLPLNLRAIRVAHAPTDRVVKSTAKAMEAVGSLDVRGLPIQLDLIERKPYAECLSRKAKADILIDQLGLGYGNSAIEAWAMGIPVIAGTELSPETREAMINAWGGLPFYEATASTLTQRLEELATDSALRAHWGEIGRSHVAKFHNERDVSELLANHYRRALALVEATSARTT